MVLLFPSPSEAVVNPIRILLTIGPLVGLVLLGPATAHAQTRANWRQLRNEMVESEIIDAGVKNPRVISAMRATERHEFVPRTQRQYAYYDMALPIGAGQTISPPFIVAYMTEQIDPQPINPTGGWGHWNGPTAIDGIEWFASASDL